MAQEAQKRPAAPSGPQEMKGGEWLATRPQAVLDQISKTPIRKG